MFDKKKLNFWRLAFIFMGITIAILVMLWSTPQASKAGMMTGSMGSMMKSMHVSNIKIYDLFSNPEYQQRMMETQHHAGQSSTIFTVSYLTTAVIFILLPLIIGGTITLAIVWFR